MRPLSICLVVFALGGCATTAASVSSPYMRTPEAPQPLRPAGDRALVVFVRPSAFAFGIGANVIDENGHFLGDAMARSYFAVAVPPGHHEFTVWAENTDAVAADVVAGKVYFIEVAPTMGFLSAQMHLLAVKPGLPSWARRDEWIAGSRQLMSDFASGQANLDKRAADVAERLRRAREHLSRYRGADLSSHTLGPDDGVSG